MKLKSDVYLKSVFAEEKDGKYPITRISEWSDRGDPLEVVIPDLKNAKIRSGKTVWERFADFFPFEAIDTYYSLGEGNTSLIKAGSTLKDFCGSDNIFLKNETQNPTWSFKDRGTFTCICFAKTLNESVTATISTGNMGNSTAAYGSRAGLKTSVFLPHYTPEEKISAIGIHGAEIFKIKTDNYSYMKKKILNRSEELGLRVVSGNGPIRVEGYKSTAFELFEQTGGNLPDYIAVPTSACGHIRGIFKGFRELKKASIIEKMPKMIAVQSKNINPIVAAVKDGRKDIIPALNKTSVAEAITTGTPYGGREIIDKIYKYGWLAEDISEEEIVRAQKATAEDGLFVEAASATTAAAVKQLIEKGEIKESEKVLLMLTGAGLKDLEAVKDYTYNINRVDLDNIEEWMTADE